MGSFSKKSLLQFRFGRDFQGKKIITISAKAVYIKWAAAAGAAAFGFFKNILTPWQVQFFYIPDLQKNILANKGKKTHVLDFEAGVIYLYKQQTTNRKGG
ncbi:hypothetical protein [Bacillus infantis]|jgi:hypothetical protein|uniref:hypothetical protein n=1 Tax=Bacillus infantis TaxID=324767 RepID=UPI0021553C8F|nr:hypothetical protein [Bacillus infantis]MCR6609805.1 hypothetical protein [Bacillus infantis]